VRAAANAAGPLNALGGNLKIGNERSGTIGFGWQNPSALFRNYDRLLRDSEVRRLHADPWAGLVQRRRLVAAAPAPASGITLVGVFDPEIISQAWFDPTIRPLGWWDRDLVDAPAPTSDVTIALTGQAAAFQQGTLGVSRTTALTGQAASFAQGTVGATRSITLAGQAAAFAQGTLGQTRTVALTGQAATFAQGTLTPSIGGEPPAPVDTAVGGDDAPAWREDVVRLSRRQRRLEREEAARAARLRETLERAYRAATGGEEQTVEAVLAEAVEIAPPAVAEQIAAIPMDDGIAQLLDGISAAIAAIQRKKNVVFRDDDDLALILSVF
jgi:hypothetical protein